LKTIHGGLRHLQRFEIGLLRESVRERRALLRIAPALVRPLTFLAPTYGHGLRGREALTIGMLVNDALSRDRNEGLGEAERIPSARMLSASEVQARVPGIPAAGLSGGALWCDAQATDSQRLLLAFLHAASDAGAVLANGVRVESLLRDGARVIGVDAVDGPTGERLAVRARVVLNAAGPGISGLLKRAGIEKPRIPLLRAWNLVLRRALVPGLAVGALSKRRYFFAVPWRDRAIVGTDYEAADRPGDPDRVKPFFADVQAAFPWASLRSDDVALVHVGLVPGERDANGLWSRSLVVDHERENGTPGLVSILGAKFTTARAVAEKALDIVAPRLGNRVACRTGTTSLARGMPLTGTIHDQIGFAIAEEMPLGLADMVLRRLDLATGGVPENADVERILMVMADLLGWGAAKRDDERATLEQALAPHVPRLL
jgi:glycerol-3-phosphate dehydrogenase